jgi:magnesium transporter
MPRVILGTTPIAPLLPARRGTALALLEIGSVGLFAAAVAERELGPIAPAFLFAAVLLGFALRVVDLEACALFIPGGFYGAAGQAFGGRAAKLSAAMELADSLMFGTLVAAAAGQGFTASAGHLLRVSSAPQGITLDDLSMTLAASLIALGWFWRRQGWAVSDTSHSRMATGAAAVVVLVAVAGFIAALSHPGGLSAAVDIRPIGARFSVFGALVGAGFCLFAAGPAHALGHAALEFPQPRIQNLRKAARALNGYALLATAGVGFLFVWLVPSEERGLWRGAPLAAVASHIGPGWIGWLLAASVSIASVAFLGLALRRSGDNAQQLLLRLSEDGLLPRQMREPHPRFGTPHRLATLVAIAQLVILVATAGQLVWLAKAYAVIIAGGGILKCAALIRLRSLRPGSRPFRVSLNPRFLNREWPIGLGLIALVVAVPAVALVASGDPPAAAGIGLVAALTLVFAASERTARATPGAAPQSIHEFDLLATPTLGLDRVDVRPGNLLVALRKPGALAPLAAALQTAGERDVVVMTVRLIGVDASEDLALSAETTDDERRLLDAAALLAERYGRSITLLIVPATNVFDAVAATIVRLRSSDVYVGESATLTADDQARLLGDAWERAPKPDRIEVRLAIYHSSGRTAVYYLGAHAPTLNAEDLRQIHTLWLNLVKVVGPHVHHHDVVRAALTHMEEQLNSEGAARDAALDVVRRTTRPADELAAVVRQRDFARLRDMVRNRPPGDLAAVLTDLSIEDQVVTFRVLPRKVAAATFEYLSYEAQEALLKAMAQEDVASLLNNMAPDDRTMFLEELPASATQQLLTLLTPEERTVAVTLLGYPEHSIGRLMTPDYIAVREQWTVQDVLNYIRTHGHDSETLNVIYVVDEHGVLVDDIRIRELLLTLPETRIADLMDRRFVALNAADDQDTAVTVFRREDRSALPVTDSTGVLIGIVTIDDVLDVAEATATKEIQRIGGSEALDEPYTEIAFFRMIQKRAGWLTALFLGEMLTATAMAAFEHEIERAVVLALFVPLIISSGGNSGSQASTLVIRAIALGEVHLKDWWRVMRRELLAGLTLGGILGTIGFLRITIWSAFSDLYTEHWLLVALTVGCALVGVVLWGTMIGSLLPFVLRRLGFDPATSSAPFVATLVDVTGLIIYFSVGLVILHGTLL